MTPLAHARLVVLKVGSALIVDENTGAADGPWLATVARDVRDLRDRNVKVVLVSSGAVALGRARMGLTSKTLTLGEKQAAAAAGQSGLMRAWAEAFEPVDLPVAQVLLTPDDTEVRRRFVNARATFETLLRLGAVPVVNENDTVATQELRYGDNDRMAARVAQMIGADVLVLLSDVDGLYSSDPSRNAGGRHIAEISEITPAIEAMAGGARRGRAMGSGGMSTKLEAARIAGAAGCATVIALGRRPYPLRALQEGARRTLVRPATTPAAAYKSWIAGALTPQGVVVVDDGAAAALRAGKSLLAAGVRSIEGDFCKGDAVIIRDIGGLELARGLVRYDRPDAMRIAGRRSDAIAALIGYNAGPLIHADDLSLSPRPGAAPP